MNGLEGDRLFMVLFLAIVAVVVVAFGLLPAAVDLKNRTRPKTWVRPARKYLPRYIGLRSFVNRRKIKAPAILVRWRPPGWWWFSKITLGYASTSIAVDGKRIEGRLLKGLLGHKRNTDVIELEQGAEVRVQLHGGTAPLVEYFDRTFQLGDDEILFVIAIDRFLRLPRNPTTIVEHTIVRTH